MIGSGRQAEGELYTWARVSPKGLSSLTGWRTEGRAGRQEAGEEEEEECRGQGSHPRGSSSVDGVLLSFDGAPLVAQLTPQLTPQLTDRQA